MFWDKISSNIRARIIRYARKNKYFRYFVIAVLAVYFFIYHLIRYGRAEWQFSCTVAGAAVMLLVAASRPGAADSSVVPEFIALQKDTGGVTIRSALGEAMEEISVQNLPKVTETVVQNQEHDNHTAAGEEVVIQDDSSVEDTELIEQESEAVSGNENPTESDSGIEAGSAIEETPAGADEKNDSGAADNEQKSEMPEGENPVEEGMPEEEEENQIGEGTPEEENPGDEGLAPGVSDGDADLDIPDDNDSVSDGNMDSDVSDGDSSVSGGDENEDSWDHIDGSVDENGQDDDLEEDKNNSLSQLPVLNLLSYNNGSLVNDVFFAGKDAEIIFEALSLPETNYDQVSGGDAASYISEMIYSIGEDTYTVQVKDGKAVVSLPQNISGKLTAYCKDANGRKSIITELFVVAENNLPEIVTETQKDSEGNSYVRISIEDKGELFSGIREYGCIFDGNVLDPGVNEDEVKWTELTDDFQALTGLSFNVPLEDRKEHEMTVTATDFAGNVAEQTFVVSALPGGIINVVMPTSFSMVMIGAESEGGGVVQGQDIVLCNKSSFPVKVTVKQTKVNLVSEQDEFGKIKNCDLTLGLLQAGMDEMSLPLPKGEAHDVLTFTLAEASEGTDPAALLDQAGKFSRLGVIKTPDYAAMRIYGSVSQANWQKDDLKVSLIYTFEKTATP